MGGLFLGFSDLKVFSKVLTMRCRQALTRLQQVLSAGSLSDGLFPQQCSQETIFVGFEIN